MTTIKEYKAMMEGATDVPWRVVQDKGAMNDSIWIGKNQFHSICEVRNGADDEEYGGLKTEEYNARFICASRNIAPELIRVIELAEEALEDAEGYSFGNATQQEHDARREALSEIRKLKG